MLFDFFVDGMTVAVSTEFFKFHSARGIATVFGASVSRYTRGTLVSVAATLSAFKSDNNANAFLACHGYMFGYLGIMNTFT